MTTNKETTMTKYAIKDESGTILDNMIYSSRDAAAGACQDASREDGCEYTVAELSEEFQREMAANGS
jgi:hypothetical protein